MRILSLQPEIDPRAFKINNALKGLYPDLEILTLFDDRFHVEEQLSRAPFFNNFLPEDAEYLLDVKGSRYEKQYKYYGRTWEPHVKKLAKGLERFCREKDVDIIHARPPPDHLGYIALTHTDYPVVASIHDLMTLSRYRFEGESKGLKGGLLKYRTERYADAIELWERTVCEESRALVCPYQGMAALVRDRYNATTQIIVPNAIPKGQRPRPRARLSDKDGTLHAVHVGGIDIEPLEMAPYRAIMPMLQEIAASGTHVHIYGTAPSKEKKERIRELCKRSERMHWHDPVAPPALYEELTQYDIGLVLVNKPEESLEHIRISISNKMFEYLASGLYVVASRELEATVGFVESVDGGCGVGGREGWKEHLSKVKRVCWRDEFCLEHYLPKLMDTYRELV